MIDDPQAPSAPLMVGAFPPPVHGLAAVNAAVLKALKERRATPTVVDISSPNLSRSLAGQVRRIPRALAGFMRFASSPIRMGQPLYISVSGGFGQLYEMLFVLWARLRGMNIYMHHHSFAYLDRWSILTWCLGIVAGPKATQIVLSTEMANRLTGRYPFWSTVVLSNVCFGADANYELRIREQLRCVGYISNISKEKGIFDFLRLIEVCQSSGLTVRGRIAGPFQDIETERQVRRWIARLAHVEYVGPVYGEQKAQFFDALDVLVFPTSYRNEAEPIVVHEGLSRGIPVIAYGRGAIPEIIGDGAGLVIHPETQFTPAALEQLRAWIEIPADYRAASSRALEQSRTLRAENDQRLEALLMALMRE